MLSKWRTSFKNNKSVNIEDKFLKREKKVK